MYSCPSSRAVVCMPPASLPALASVRPKATRCLPLAMSGRNLFFCCSEPNSRMGNVPSAFAANEVDTPTHALENSSTARTSSKLPSPAPPYSSGM